MAFLVYLIDLVFTLLTLAILARVLLSWVNPDPYHPIVRALYQITEPILEPIRRYLPRTGMIDFSPLVAIILLQLIQQLLVRLLLGAF
jgi:YggT family protein